MVKKIIKYPNPSLRKATSLVALPADDFVFEHIRDLNDTLKAEEDGLAIASNQILEDGLRMFVVKDDKRLNEIFEGGAVFNPQWAPLALFNQVVTEREGCLSFPGMTFSIPRYNRVMVSFQDVEGRKHEKEVEGIVARMVQHECDHLDGKLFVETLPKKTQIDIRNIVIRKKKEGKW